jgi:hypothetical protein
MSATKVPYGKPVKLLADYQGYPDGRLVQFKIWRKKGGEEKEISAVYGVTKGGKGIGRWIPQVERKEILPLEEKISQPVEEEKYYFIAKIDDKEVKSEDFVFTYSLEVYLEDEDGVPIDDIEFTVKFSDGSKEEGIFRDGRVRFEDAPPGKFTLELEYYEFVFKQHGKIIKARWDKAKAKCGDEVKIVVDVEDFEDGTPAKFTIWEKDVDGKNDRIEQIDGKVQGNKVEALWVYSAEDVEEDLKDDVEEEKGVPEYFFVVEIEGKEASSKILTFTYLLDIYLEDEDGTPLDDVEYTVFLSDGTERKGKFENGHAKIDDAPYGSFTVEVRGYDLVFD